MDKAESGKKNLNVAFQLKKALIQAIKESSLSRDQIADRMNELLESEGLHGDVTKAIIDSWTKEDPKRSIPTLLIPFFCEVTQSILPIAIIAKAAGALVIGGNDLHLLELGISEYQKHLATQRQVQAWLNLGINHPFRLEK
jgi:hypothetical protein